MLRGGYWYWDLSWLSTTAIGSRQLEKEAVSKWANPLLRAFLAGAWYLFWTDRTLYWVAKPQVCSERVGQNIRLHNETGPACANDVENLYFWHGVLVPAYAIVCPEWITLDEIKHETNEEVRRVLIERYGWPKYLKEVGAKLRSRRLNERDQQWEELYQLDDGTQRVVVSDPSTGRRYALGVPRDVATCQDAQKWLSHGLDSKAVHRS